MPRIPDNESSYTGADGDLDGTSFMDPSETLTASGMPLLGTYLQESDK